MGTNPELEQKRAGLSAAKQALLEKRLRGGVKRDPAQARIPRRPDGSAIPLSFSQRRLWFLDRLTPGAITYNVPMARHLAGPLDLGVLCLCIREVVRRHEILRTAYVLKGGEPEQKVMEVSNFPIPVTDLSALPAAERDREWRAQALTASTCSFDLAAGDVFRVHLWRLGPEEHVLLFAEHHIAADAWSTTNLFSEIGKLYPAFLAGQPSPLEELPVQYGDFSIWQNAAFQGPAFESQVNYWKEKLGGNLPVLELPTDRPRPPSPSHQGHYADFYIGSDVLGPIKALAQQQSSTLFMLLLAAFKVLLIRYSQQEDIVVGTPVAGRNRSELEPLIGFFINTLVMRTDVGGDPTFLELLERVKETALGAYANQDVPLERLVEEIAPVRDQSVNPLFQVMFVLQNAPIEFLQLPGVKTTQIEIPIAISKFDLTFGMWEKGDGLQGWLEYSTDIFDEATITRMVAHFANLLRSVIASPESRVSELPLLDGEERRKLVEDLNRTGREYAGGLRMQDLFEEQVRKTPGACALVYCGPDGTGAAERWSYEKLNRRSNQLADRLRQEGVGPDVLVGVCHERSPELVVCLLGVLKAGGAYVPIDPNYPQQRVAFMLEDTGAPVLLTQKSLVGRLPTGVSRAICLDEEETAKDLSGRPEGNPGAGKKETRETDLAYVIFTSGSTGRPKGVALEHRNAVKFIQWAKEVFTVEELSRVLFSTSVCFDLSVYEVFVTLSSGGAIVLAENALALPTLSAREEITLINTVPSAAAELVRLKAVPKSVEVVNLAGEALSVELVKGLYGIGTVRKVYDLYGPSEDTTYSTYTLRRADGPATIGRPIANTQAYVMDGHRQLVPFGVPGELYLGGDGLARGYLNRPELTAERFVENPVEGAPSRRLYRTGDLVRYLADGNLEYLGRMDQQVKIRGFRIELGEIESAIRNLAGVKDCVVVAREDKQGDPQIVAYLVLTGEAAAQWSAADLWSLLKPVLPDYMIPVAFIALPALPLTPNGKVDRKALPAPDKIARRADESYEAPRDPVEIQIARIWERLLDIPKVGLKDNFFELGGHSLLAVHLFVEIEKTLGKNLPLATLFHAPTVQALAQMVRDGGGKVMWSSLVPIQPKGNKAPLFCIHAAGGNVLFYRDLALRLGEDQPFYGLQPKGLDGSSERHKTIEEMAAHYIHEIRTVQPQGPYYIGGSSYGGLVAWEMACQLEQAGERVALLALFDTHGPGYPEYLPNISPLKLKLNTYAQLFRHHWSTLCLLPSRQRWEYVIGKGRKLRTRLKRIFRRRVKRVGNAVFRWMDKSIPQSLQVAQDVILTAGDQYTPRPYSGPVTVFRASDQPYGIKPSTTLGWDKVAKGELILIEITGYHGTMVVEPRVGLLVDRLRPMLSKGA